MHRIDSNTSGNNLTKGNDRQVMEQQHNQLNLYYRSFLQPFNHFSFKDDLTEVQFNSLCFPEYKPVWDQSNIEIPAQNRSLPDNCQQSSNQIDDTRIHVLVQKNERYRQIFNMFKQILQQIVINIQIKLSGQKGFNYFTDFSESSEIEECVGMTKFIEATINKIAENSFQFDTLQQNILYLKVQNQILTKDNEKLVTHIEERKKYSQKLKAKIISLQEDLVKEAKKMQNLGKKLDDVTKSEIALKGMLQELDKIEEGVQLKFRSRNDLIMMIKSLATKLLKHQHNCPNWSQKAQNIQKFLTDLLIMKKKSAPIAE